MWNWMELHDSLLPALFQVMVITTLTLVRAGHKCVLERAISLFTHEKRQAQRVADSGSWR